MSNISVKRSFTASAETYNTHITASKLIRGLFVCLYMQYRQRILTKCWPILKMLQTLTYVICCEDKQLAEDRTRRTIDVIYSLRESNNYYWGPFPISSTIHS